MAESGLDGGEVVGSWSSRLESWELACSVVFMAALKVLLLWR